MPPTLPAIQAFTTFEPMQPLGGPAPYYGLLLAVRHRDSPARAIPFICSQNARTLSAVSGASDFWGAGGGGTDSQRMVRTPALQQEVARGRSTSLFPLCHLVA